MRQARSIDLPSGTRLSYVEQGHPSGVPVVLLHGYTDSWRSFERVLPYLPNSMRVFAISQRGHGDAGRPADGYRAEDFAKDVAAFLAARRIERAIVVGHSMGATIAQRFAIDFPNRTQALVLVASLMPRPGNAAVREFWQSDISTLTDPIAPHFVRDFQQSTLKKEVPAEFFEAVVQESLKVPARVWKAALEPLVTTDFSAELRAISAPTLIVWGDQDAFVRHEEQRELQSSIAGSRLVVYPGVGHAVHWEEPGKFADELMAFVGNVEVSQQ
jgi:pimeloyl-ACP methyl ester carboxylesterase